MDEHSNEIPAVPALLELLALDGCVVTVDAMHCQTATAQALVDHGADYLLVLKTNQPLVHDAVATYFDEALREHWPEVTRHMLETTAAGHGRVERRRHWTSADPDLLAYLTHDGAWPQLGSVGRIERTRTTPEKSSREVTYYLSSLAGEVALFAHLARGHWGIENGQHWVLDVAFREDESRVRVGYGAENFGVLRRVALNLLQQDTATRAGIKARRLKAGWDERYLLALLNP